MAKKKVQYVCQECGAKRFRYEGRCSDCGAWNSFVEEVEASSIPTRGWALGSKNGFEVRNLSQPMTSDQLTRWTTRDSELDRVLGGGLVPGSYTLIGGDPGIGKSTLLMQMAGGLARSKKKVLYVSAEESVNQTGLRAQRLGVLEASVQVASESLVERIIEMAEHISPDVLIIDSIQTVYLGEITSAPGSVSQVRECAARLMALAKNKSMSIFLVGHVTKDGQLAGPRVLEHMVDTVLSFEGDHHHQFRLLRATKNRFGPTNELGVFQMSAEGLQPVLNPSELFLEERRQGTMGSAVFAGMEGTRPLLCEVQGLVAYSGLTMPRRNALGIDSNRLMMLIAVLDRHLHLEASQKDIFVNVVGGLKLSEPASDLSVAAALLSSQQNVEINGDTVFFGEIGLTGEVRACQFAEERCKEAFKLGFKTVFLPEANRKHFGDKTLLKKSGLQWLRQIKDLKSVLLPSGKVKKPNKPKDDGFELGGA